MNSPFVYGKIALAENFTDRKEETASLKTDFLNLTNTIVISPRRWGKSSLIQRAGEEAAAADKKIRICHLDIFNARNEDEFYEKLAAAVIKGTSSKVEELFATASRYASALIPTLTASDTMNKVGLEFHLGKISRNADDILDMAERIAEDKGLRIVICIDEFQQIANYPETDAFQAKLRSHWQTHQRVAYCLYGSRRHMMTDIFTNQGKPFYKFGKTVFLERIPAELWLPFIRDKFLLTGKTITEKQCRHIVSAVDNNPYYIQQLSEEVWNRTADVVSDDMVEDAFQGIVRSQAALNLMLTQTLTLSMQNLLHAIVNGEKELSSQHVMERYGLKNSLTVSRAKKALAAMDIVDDFGKQLSMEDPVYAWWLKNVYFNRI